MKQFTITIQDKEGLHARPAGLLSKAAKGFQCAVTLTKGEKAADLKKIFAVMVWPSRAATASLLPATARTRKLQLLRSRRCSLRSSN